MRAAKWLVGGLAVMLTVSVAGADGQRKIAVLDNCDPDDATWAPTGGCALKEGDVTLAEFNALLSSSLSPFTVVGHPSWRNEPSYLTVRSGKGVRVTNEGGRAHTFTEVAAFGGGRVPPLTMGLTPAPECLVLPDPTALAPGAHLELKGLSAGLHRFQCCLHPWMRAAIRVEGD
jgi:plastocyanin